MDPHSGANQMLRRHPTAPRFSRPLLHLISFGVAGAVVMALFGLASFSLLNGSKERVTGSRIAQGAVTTELSSSAATPAANGDPMPAAGETTPSNMEAAEQPPASLVKGPPTPEAPAAKSEAKTVPTAPPPDSDRAAAVPETLPAPPPADRSADGTPAPEVTEAQQPAARPAPPADQPSPTPETSKSAIPQANASISDQERAQMFHSFELEQKRRLSNPEAANPMSTRKGVAHSARNGALDKSLFAHNAGFRSRVRKECGPIKDPALYHQCVATFTSRYR
jgi:hypothetical protein